MIILFIALGLTAIIFGFIWFYNRLIKRESQSWQVGDLVSVSEYIDHGVELYELVGWSRSNIYVKTKAGVTKLKRSVLNYNKSASWRVNHDECVAFMGCEPGFSPELTHVDSSEKIDGKPIELLTEIECQVYLKQALEKEDYKLAETIRKRMENFR